MTPGDRRAATKRQRHAIEQTMRKHWADMTLGEMAQEHGCATSFLSNLAKEMGMGPKPQMRGRKRNEWPEPGGITAEQLAWARGNPTHAEAGLIALWWVEGNRPHLRQPGRAAAWALMGKDLT